MKSKLICASLCIFSMAIFSSCTQKKSLIHPTDMLRIDIGSEPPSLDPNHCEDISSLRIMSDLFAQLVDYDQKNIVIPGLAKKWEISSDGKTYTFYLRPNLKFSDGSPLTAHDVVFSWQRLVDPKTGSSYNFILDNVVNGQAIIDGKMLPSTLGVSAPNDSTVVVKLVTPDASFLDKNTLPNLAAISQKAVEKYGDKWTEPDNMVTSGAYKLKEHVLNGYVLAEKNQYFYAATDVQINQVKYLPYVDTNTAVSSYAAGDLDATFQNVPVDQYSKLKIIYKEQMRTVKQEALGFYEFNMKLPEFANNLKLRQALSLAIDRDVISHDILNDQTNPVYSVVTPTVEDGQYEKLKYEWSNWSKDRRIAYAKKLYAEAGYAEGHPLNITITYNTNDMYKKITLAIASMWKTNLGVKVNIENQEWKQFLQTRHKGAYQVARGGWFADYNSVSTYVEQYTCNSPQNDSKWCNKDFDSLVVQANKEQNPARRIELYKLAIQIAEDSYAIIPLFQYSYTRLVKPYIDGYEIENNYLDHVQTRWMKLAK